MRHGVAAVVFMAAVLPCGSAGAAQPDPMCAPVRAFVGSVKPDDTRQVAFHTSWGSNFNGSSVPAIFAKQCIHHDYAQAKELCAYLMAHGAVEFSGTNAQRALVCLSPGTRFNERVQLNQGEFSFSYGTDQRGSNVTLTYAPDTKLGGMVLAITADGY
jgi:hypothetical protein